MVRVPSAHSAGPAVVRSRTVPGLVSIVTPTHNRPAFLRAAARYVGRQDYPDIEWLILDDSPAECESCADLAARNVFYERVTRRLSIGEKRNRLIERCRGEIIVQFDDDDYYAPGYVSMMLALLSDRRADLVNLRGWFLYDLRSRFFGYWDLECKVGQHFQCDGSGVHAIHLTPENNAAFLYNHLGFGFSYAFRKCVWEAVKFPDRDWGEDAAFVLAAQDRFRLDGLRDTAGVCLHVLHVGSTSRCFPQFNVPAFLLPAIFPAEDLLEASHDAAPPGGRKD